MLGPGMFATDRAIELAAGGVPFREAYVQAAKQPLPSYGDDPESSLRARVSPGAGAALDLGELKRRLAAVAKLSPGILLEDKGYSLALHYRLAPHAEKAIYEAVSLIRADLPNAPIEVLPGKCVCEIKHSGFTKASGVHELMKREPFKGRRPFFIGDDVTDETVFAIMPDLDGLAFSVGRRAKGVAGHFDAPSDVREFLAHLLDDERDVSLP
jgi:trehalose 6-phosphate phosphatase